jgi:hypothetical protein
MSDHSSHPRESSESFPSAKELLQSLQNEWTKELIDIGLGDVIDHLSLDLVEKNGVVKVPSPIFGWDLENADRGITQEESERLLEKYTRFLDEHHISYEAGIPVSGAGKEHMLHEWSQLMVSGEDGPCKAMAKALKNIGLTDQELEDAAVQFIPPLSHEELEQEGYTSEEIIQNFREDIRRILGLPFPTPDEPKS